MTSLSFATLACNHLGANELEDEVREGQARLSLTGLVAERSESLREGNGPEHLLGNLSRMKDRAASVLRPTVPKGLAMRTECWTGELFCNCRHGNNCIPAHKLRSRDLFERIGLRYDELHYSDFMTGSSLGPNLDSDRGRSNTHALEFHGRENGN